MGSFVENVNKLATNMPVNGWASFDEKVDKVIGKQLSSEDYTLTEKNKLAGIAIQATQNSSDAVLLNRGNHTGTQSIDTIEESDTLKILTAAEREKLDAMSPHPSKHHVSIIDGSLNPAKFIKSDAVGNVGFDDVTWSDIQGKPSSYNPNAHQHSLSDLSDAILKADKTYVDTQLATKVDTSTLTTELSKKADANTVATDAELQAAVETLQPLSQKGQANGYVPLDSGGKIPNSYLNNLSTIEVFTTNSQANMLLLSNVSVGDQCIRTDLATNNLFILTQTPSTEITNWKQINTSASVLSVNGQTGVVNVSKADVGLGNVDNTADVNKAVLSATKLATARTISLTSDVTGSGNFDGSGNISITATVADNSHNHTLSNISDFPSAISATELGYLDGVTSNIQTQISAKQATLVSATNIKTINGNTILGSGDLVVVGGDMLKSIYDTTSNGKVDVAEVAESVDWANVQNKPVIADMTKAVYDTTNNGIVDRAETADKLTTPRTINGTSFDGSANINIEDRLGTAIASAATTTLGSSSSGDTIHITGTTTITSFGASVTGVKKTLIFDASLTLTHNGTSLILPASTNIVTSAGDSADFVCENGASGNWRCVGYTKASISVAELGYLDGVASNIQAQIDTKQTAAQVTAAITAQKASSTVYGVAKISVSGSTLTITTI